MGGVDTGLVEEVGHRANVILLAPTFGSGAERWCSSLLASDGTDPGAVVYVTDARTPDGVVDAWRERDCLDLPERLGFVTFDTMHRTDGTADDVGDVDGVDVRYRPIDSPGNLTKLGVELNGMLTDWSPEVDRLVVCFQALTAMIQYGDVEQVYRFLHVFTNQVRSTGATAHYHLDPTAHEATDVNLLKTTVDAVVEADGEGDARVRTRS